MTQQTKKPQVKANTSSTVTQKLSLGLAFARIERQKLLSKPE